MLEIDTVGHLYPPVKQVLKSPAFALLTLGAALLNLVALFMLFSACALANMASAPSLFAQAEAGAYLL